MCHYQRLSSFSPPPFPSLPPSFLSSLPNRPSNHRLTFALHSDSIWLVGQSVMQIIMAIPSLLHFHPPHISVFVRPSNRLSVRPSVATSVCPSYVRFLSAYLLLITYPTNPEVFHISYLPRPSLPNLSQSPSLSSLKLFIYSLCSLFRALNTSRGHSMSGPASPSWYSGRRLRWQW